MRLATFACRRRRGTPSWCLRRGHIRSGRQGICGSEAGSPRRLAHGDREPEHGGWPPRAGPGAKQPERPQQRVESRYLGQTRMKDPVQIFGRRRGRFDRVDRVRCHARGGSGGGRSQKKEPQVRRETQTQWSEAAHAHSRG